MPTRRERVGTRPGGRVLGGFSNVERHRSNHHRLRYYRVLNANKTVLAFASQSPPEIGADVTLCAGNLYDALLRNENGADSEDCKDRKQLDPGHVGDSRNEYGRES